LWTCFHRWYFVPRKRPFPAMANKLVYSWHNWPFFCLSQNKKTDKLDKPASL